MAKAGYLATAVGILRDNGSIARVCVTVMVGVVSAKHFSMALVSALYQTFMTLSCGVSHKIYSSIDSWE